jgi:phosphoribosylaminoimidazole-succinocarboxamide synthase
VKTTFNQGKAGKTLAVNLRKDEPVTSGKVKDVYLLNEKELEFRFSDRISVFDKIIPSAIPHKGESLAQTSAYWFKAVEQLGIQTHFIELTAPDRMRVKRVDVIRDYSLLTPETKNYLIPGEFITRYYVTGSLEERLLDGTIKPEQLGFAPHHETKHGEILPKPFFEATTKLEEVDRHLTDEEAIRISGITPKEFAQIKETCLRIDELMGATVRRKNLIHVDGKKEFAFDRDRKLMLIDTFGTLDEDRWWQRDEFLQGKYVEKSKEIARQHYKKIGYYAKLMEARKEGREEPAIPPLPDELKGELSMEYVAFKDTVGELFR